VRKLRDKAGVRGFQLFGFDFLVDALRTVHLLEVNGSPAIAQALRAQITADLADVLLCSLGVAQRSHAGAGAAAEGDGQGGPGARAVVQASASATASAGGRAEEGRAFGEFELVYRPTADTVSVAE
jgi:hypothetical protein